MHDLRLLSHLHLLSHHSRDLISMTKGASPMAGGPCGSKHSHSTCFRGACDHDASAPDLAGGEQIGQPARAPDRLAGRLPSHSQEHQTSIVRHVPSFQELAAARRHKPLEAQPRTRVLALMAAAGSAQSRAAMASAAAPDAPRAIERSSESLSGSSVSRSDDDVDQECGSHGTSSSGESEPWTDSSCSLGADGDTVYSVTAPVSDWGGANRSARVDALLGHRPSDASATLQTALHTRRDNDRRQQPGPRPQEAARSRHHILGHTTVAAEAAPLSDVAGQPAPSTPRNLHEARRRGGGDDGASSSHDGGGGVGSTVYSRGSFRDLDMHHRGLCSSLPTGSHTHGRAPSSADLKFLSADAHAAAAYVPYSDDLRDLGLELSATQHADAARDACGIDEAVLRRERVLRLRADEAAHRLLGAREQKLAEELAKDRKKVLRLLMLGSGNRNGQLHSPVPSPCGSSVKTCLGFG